MNPVPNQHHGAGVWRRAGRRKGRRSVAASVGRQHGNQDAKPPQAHGGEEPQFVTVSGDLRDSKAVRAFHQRCKALIASGPRQVALNLSGVDQADTKLVAALVLIACLARSADIAVNIQVSSTLREWIAVCRWRRRCARAVRAERRWRVGITEKESCQLTLR